MSVFWTGILVPQGAWGLKGRQARNTCTWGIVDAKGGKRDE